MGWIRVFITCLQTGCLGVADWVRALSRLRRSIWLGGCQKRDQWMPGEDWNWPGLYVGPHCRGREHCLLPTADTSDVHNLIICFPAQISRYHFLIWGTNQGPWCNTPTSNAFLLQSPTLIIFIISLWCYHTCFFYYLGVIEPQINWRKKKISDKWEPTASECSSTGCTAQLAFILVN